MFNDFQIGSLTLHMYGLMMAVGFLAALGLCLLRRKKLGLDDNIVWGIFYCAIIGGILGAKLLFIIVEFPQILKDITILTDLRNGYVVYGGILGGIFCSWLYCRWKKAPFFKYFDLVMPAVSLAQGFGRIGCFCAGCCYGRETDSAFCIVFHNSMFAPNGVGLIPTQLISSVANFVLGLILIWYASRRPKDGRVAAAWMVFYGIGRFAIEFLRNDYRGSIGILSTSQIISICIVSAGISLWLVLGKLKGDEDKEPDVEVKEE